MAVARLTNLAHSMLTIIDADAVVSPSSGSGFPFIHKMYHSKNTKHTSRGKVCNNQHKRINNQSVSNQNELSDQ